MPIQPTVLKAPAKLNLTLEILNKRDDGYHSLRSVMVPVDLADEIRIEPAERFTFWCSVPELTENNLVISALHAAGADGVHMRVELEKHIPAGAGLGGGSSDAAAILLAAQAGAFGERVIGDVVQIARSVGSDVPFFLVQTGALVEGTGERVTAVGALPRWYALVVRPPVTVSTAEAYRLSDGVSRETRARNASASLRMVEALQERDFEQVVSLMSNDFEPIVGAMSPEIPRALNALRNAGAAKALLSGSGACVFALFQTREEAERAERTLDLDRSFMPFVCAFNDAHAWRPEARR